MERFEEALFKLINWFNRDNISLAQLEKCFEIISSLPSDHISYFQWFFLCHAFHIRNSLLLKKFQEIISKGNYLELDISLRFIISKHFKSSDSDNQIYKNQEEDTTVPQSDEIDDEIKWILTNFKEFFDEQYSYIDSNNEKRKKNKSEKKISFLFDLPEESQLIRQESLIKSLKIIKYFDSNPNIFKAVSAISNKEIYVTGLVEESIVPLPENIKEFYTEGKFPTFYDSLKFPNESSRATILELSTETLKPYIVNFHKMNRSQKLAEEELKINQAEKLFKFLLRDLALYRKHHIDFHRNIYPHNILVYESTEYSHNLRFKLVFPKIVENSPASGGFNATMPPIPTNEFRYLPPEIAYSEYYVRRFGYVYGRIDYHKVDIWSIGVCALHMITDKYVDKWNRLDANNILTLEVVKLLRKHENFKESLLSCLRLNYEERNNVEGALELLLNRN